MEEIAAHSSGGGARGGGTGPAVGHIWCLVL